MLIFALLARDAHAQVPPQVRIHWDDLAACERPHALEARIARLMGPSMARAQPLDAALAVRKPRPHAYELTVGIEGPAGHAERTLQLASCAEVERAAALVIATALQLDTLSLSDGNTDIDDMLSADSDEAALPSAPPPSATADDSLPEVKPEPAPARSDGVITRFQRWISAPASWSVRLGMISDTHALPGMTVGPNVGVGVAIRDLHAWLEGRYLFARETIDGRSGLHSELDLFAGSIGAAYAWHPTRALELGPMVEGEAGILRGRVLGERGAGRARAPWLATLWGAYVAWTVREGVALSLQAELGVAALRSSFVLLEQPAVYRIPPLTARIACALRVQIGR